MRWKYTAANMQVEVAGVLLRTDAEGLLPVLLPEQVLRTCADSPVFTQVADPVGAPDDGTPPDRPQKKKR